MLRLIKLRQAIAMSRIQHWIKLLLYGEISMIKKNTLKQRVLALVLPVFVAMMFNFSADAASCKGKSESSCSADKNCSWVSGYKRKDGVKVSGHCRAASGKANKEQTQNKSKNKKSETKAQKDKSSKDKKSKDKSSKSTKSTDKKSKDKSSKTAKSTDKKSKDKSSKSTKSTDKKSKDKSSKSTKSTDKKSKDKKSKDNTNN